MGWPQWAMLAIIALNFFIAFAERSVPQAMSRVTGSALTLALLYAGGFWS